MELWLGHSRRDRRNVPAVYNLDSRLKTDRVSQIYLEGLHDRNYASMRFYNTQSLLFTDEPFSDSTVFPIIDYDYIVNRPIIGGELSYNSNVMVFQIRRASTPTG